MKQKFTLALALVLAVGAVAMIRIYQVSIEESVVQEYETVRVLVAARDIQRGERLSSAMVMTDNWPQRYLHRNAIPEGDESIILDQEVINDIPAGEQLLYSDVAGIQTGNTLSAAVETGKRAVTIGVDSVSGMNGHLRPDDLVDVIVTLNVPRNIGVEGGEEIDSRDPQAVRQFVLNQSRAAGFQLTKVSMTILQAVKIIAVGPVTGATAANLTSGGSDIGRASANVRGNRAGAMMAYETVTLLVDPLDAEILKFVDQEGEVSLSLRSPDDLEFVELPRITLAEILDLKFQDAEAAPRRGGRRDAPAAPSGPRLLGVD